MREGCGHRIAHIEVAPTLSDIVERGIYLVDIERGDELQARLLKVGQPLEVVGQVSTHLELAHTHPPSVQYALDHWHKEGLLLLVFVEMSYVYYLFLSYLLSCFSFAFNSAPNTCKR